jgi:hypothetical protein
MNENRHSDDEILNGVRRRLAGAEPLIPQPPALGPAFTESAQIRPRVVVRSRVGLGGFAPMVLVAAFVVVAVGVGVGSQAFNGNGSGAFAGTPGPSGSPASPNYPGFGLSYQLVHPAGTQVTPAELDATKAILMKRAESLGPTSYSVNEAPPDGITVWLEGVADTAEVRALIGQTGHLEFVLLPPETYGTLGSPGQTMLPNTGETIDPALPAQFTGADLDLGAMYLREDTATGGSALEFGFKEPAASAFETWSAQHVNDFFAIVLDGKVLSVPYIKSTIVGGRGEISGAFTAQSAAELLTILQSGWLPYPLLGGAAAEPIGSPDAGPGVAPSDVPMHSGAPIAPGPNGSSYADPTGSVPSGVPLPSGAAIESGVPLHSGAPSAP